MDRIEAYNEEETTSARLQPLGLDLTRFQVKPVANLDHAQKTALAAEIHKLWGIPIPRLMVLIKWKGMQCVRETYEQVRKDPKVSNPPALFLWKLKNQNVKVELKDMPQ